MLEKLGGRCRTDKPIRVLLCQMRHTIAAIAESLVTDAERSNRRVTCLLHIISDGTRVRHAQGITPLILLSFIACAATVQTAVLVLFGPSCLGHYRPLQLLHAHCLGLLLLSVCVFKNYIFGQAKVYRVYRVLAVNGLPTSH